MQNSFLPKIALCLFSLALAVPALARSWDDFTPQDPSLKQSGHWEWAWDGEDNLGVNVGATVHYVAGGPARIVATGPDALLEKLRVGQGEIRWCEDCSIRGGRLDITVSGVTLHKVALHGGGGDIQLGRLDQDRLRLAISGAHPSAAGNGQTQADGSTKWIWRYPAAVMPFSATPAFSAPISMSPAAAMSRSRPARKPMSVSPVPAISG